MDSAAVTRLNHVGKLFIVAGIAAQKLGGFLENPSHGQLEECFTDLANCFVEASSLCETLADLSGSQHNAGQEHGYEVADSAALATLQIMFEGFGAPVLCVSSLDFTMSNKDKSTRWLRAAATLSRSAAASRRQINLLGMAMPDLVEVQEKAKA